VKQTSHRTNTACHHLFQIAKRSQIPEVENKMVVTRAKRRGKWGVTLE
jgi:hypothetical protein